MGHHLQKTKALLVVLTCWWAVTANGQEKLSVEVKRLVSAVYAESHAAGNSHEAQSRRTAYNETVCVFMKFKDGQGERLMSQYGCRKVTQIGAVYIVNVPLSQLGRLAAEDDVVRIETHTGGRMLLDVTPQWINSEPIYSGQALPQAFTGKGVLVGIIDGGFDVTHPAFYATDGQQYRIKRFVDDYGTDDETIGTQTPLGREYATQEDILAKAHSGDISETHGTHCLSIAAGSGYGTPYRGIAYDADLFPISSEVAFGSYAAPSEVARMKYIFDYAEANHQPCVITYSIGFEVRPGDALLYEEALQGVQGPGKVLVVAAGNENDSATYIEKPVGKEAAGATFAPLLNDGHMYIVSEQPFQLKVITTLNRNANVSPKYWKSDSLVIDSENLPAEELAVNGQHVTMTREGFFYTLSLHQVFEERNGRDGNPLICVEGKEADVKMYVGNDSYFVNLPQEDIHDGRFDDAEHSHNVSLPGTFQDVITVGALTGRQSFININGETQKVSNDYVEGRIALFSSVGPTLEGLTKPDVVAPGVNIIAAANSFNNYHASATAAKTTFNGREYPWKGFSGTSMATPCAAGIVALWLQADPTLTPEKVKDIIKATSHQTVEGLESPNNTYGYGLIDAYAGICHILGIGTAIKNVSTHQPSAVAIRPAGNGQVVLQFATVPNQPFTVRTYTVGGRLLQEQTLQPGAATRYTVGTGTHQGLCVVQVNSLEAGVTGSEIIRF